MLLSVFNLDAEFFNSILLQVAHGNPLETMWYIVKNGGWIPIVWALVQGLWSYRMLKTQRRWWGSVKFIVLAIDVPRDNEQGPKAVENIFSHFAGTHGSINLWQKYVEGQAQLTMSLEIVSIDGYVQFMMRLPEVWRDIVESAIYAQYPDAEIEEVDDYTQYVPQHWPHPEYKFFGLEYKLFKHEAYPIRTYEEFEDKLEGEFKDPMAALLEAMSSLRKGEQVWVQYVITPINDKWVKGVEEVVNKLAGIKEEHAGPAWYVRAVSFPFTVLGMVWGHVIGTPQEAHEEKKDDGPHSLMMHLTPGLKDDILAIEEKADKIGFKTKIRVMYIARKEVYSKPRGIGSIIGALKQYNTINLNRFDICKKVWTQAYYIFPQWRIARRQNKLFDAYKFRSNWRGDVQGGGVLNIEELASLWHFPVVAVRAALVKKTEAKKREPPVELPVSREIGDVPVHGARMHLGSPSEAHAPAGLEAVMEEDDRKS
ncbi:hypothetical protein HY624_04285 [Candidatus Uhrbacteria bacterium]|nr:hypothetical protein [Candidatus Uhrbacteria bacterium]